MANEEQFDEMFEEIMAEMRADEVSWSETVKIGDWVDCSSDGHYTFSGHQYKTENKLYQVRMIDIRKDENGKVYSRTVVVDGDYFDPSRNGEPERVWMGNGRVIVRNGEIIWESSLQKRIKAYIAAGPTPEMPAPEIEKLKAMAYYPNLEGTC